MTMTFVTNRTRRQRALRSGATIVECAIVLPVLFGVLFGMLDLGLAATRYNALAEAARRVAREAIVHGALAPSATGTWGPTAFSGTAASGSTIVATIQHELPTMTASKVNVTVTWPNGTNSPRNPVKVEVTFVHHPLVPGFSLWGALTLHAAATMQIIN
jgi:Flp pilus assembly protein TadG